MFNDNNSKILNKTTDRNISNNRNDNTNTSNNNQLNQLSQLSQLSINDKNLNGILKDYLNVKHKINSENQYMNEKINMNLNMSLDVDTKQKKSYLKDIDLPIKNKNSNDNIHNLSCDRSLLKSEKKNVQTSNSLIDKINKMKNNTLSIGKDKESEFFGSLITPVKILDWLFLGNYSTDRYLNNRS